MRRFGAQIVGVTAVHNLRLQLESPTRATRVFRLLIKLASCECTRGGVCSFPQLVGNVRLQLVFFWRARARNEKRS